MHSFLSRISAPPDLLGRFIETPFCFRLNLDGACIRLMTNEPALLSDLASVMVTGEAGVGEIASWKLISDSEASAPGPVPRLTDSGSILTAWFGPGCLMSLDCDCAEAYAFVPPASGEFCAAVLVPLFSSWLQRRVLLRKPANKCDTGEREECD